MVISDNEFESLFTQMVYKETRTQNNAPRRPVSIDMGIPRAWILAWYHYSS